MFLFLIFLHCPLSRPVLIYISLLIIFCIIEYVTNKRPLNLEPLNLSLGAIFFYSNAFYDLQMWRENFSISYKDCFDPAAYFLSFLSR